MTNCLVKCSNNFTGAVDMDCFEDCVPKCNPVDSRQGYEHIGRKGGNLSTFEFVTWFEQKILLKEEKALSAVGIAAAVSPTADVTPTVDINAGKLSGPTDGDLVYLAIPGILQSFGYEGMCRQQLGDGSSTWYAAKKFAGMDHFMIFNDLNKNSATINDKFDSEEFELTPGEVVGLRKALNILEYDMACVPESCPTEDVTGKISSGKYRFTYKVSVMNRWIAILEDKDVKIESLSPEKRERLVAHLERIRDEGNVDMDFKNTSINQGWWIAAGVTIGAIGTGLLIWDKVRDFLLGRVKFTNFEEVIKETLKLDPAFDIWGRNDEAREAWELADTHPDDGYRHVIFDAPTGEGKDEIVRKMILMKAQGDPSVPERFQHAKVKKVNAAEFQAKTKFRGTVADKVAEIAKDARKGPVIYYISEIDLLFLSGGTSNGDSEVVGKLLLDLIEDPKIRQNLIIIGTTSRGHEMVATYPDLKRRFNWPHVRQFTLADVADLIAKRVTGKDYAERRGVTVSPEVSDAATRLAEAFYRPFTANGTVMPRFDAVKQVLSTAVKIAKKAGAKELTVDHVIAAAELRIGVSLDRAAVDAVLKIEVINDIPVLQQMARLLREQAAYEGVPNVEILSDSKSILAEWRALPAVERDGQEIPSRSWVMERITAIAEGKLSGRAEAAVEKKGSEKDKEGKGGVVEDAREGRGK